MKVDVAITNVEHSERELAKRLRVVGERHAADHDIYHLSHTLARRCGEHLQSLRPVVEPYGVDVGDPNDESSSPGLIEEMRHTASELLGRREASGMILLRDLRDLYITAQQAEIDWVVLIQAAKAARDPDLLQAATHCHEETETVGKWLRTRLKQAAPQVLVAG